MKSSSLKTSFRKLSIRWTLGAFVLTLVLSMSFFLYISSQLEKNRISTLAQSVTRAFRVMILDKNFRDAQIQMRRVLDLKEGEHIVVRNSNFETFYSPTSEISSGTCTKSETVCADFFGYLTYLQPVYFDDDLKENLLGYVELRSKAQTDWLLFAFFIGLLVSIFSAFVVGISSTQSGFVSLIEDTIGVWAKHLKESPTSKAPSGKAPFVEFYPLETAISELHLEINELKEKAAEEARFKTQVSMLREISHDLKTPFSQLAKFFLVHLARVERTGKSDQEIVNKINRSMNKIGDLLRQVGVIGPQIKNQDFSLNRTDILSETKTFVDDFIKSHDLDQTEREVITLDLDSKVLMAAIPKAQFYRVLDNLLRNALEATDKKKAFIAVSVTNEENRPTLKVRDNGCGIEDKLLKKVFDAEFTTKPVRGTGLGLSIVKRICSDFDATIAVNSNVGLGSVFKISFACSQVQPENNLAIEAKEARI